MVREPGKEITTDADLSEREKESLYDLLERWVTMRPSGGATAISITTTFKAQFFEEFFNSRQEEGTDLDPARARGATALLSIHPNIGAYDVGFLWRGGNFSTINQKYVDLDEGLTMKLAIRRAILNYDQCETARIEQFNKTLIIAFWRQGRRRSPWWAIRTESTAASRWSSWLGPPLANLYRHGEDCQRLRATPATPSQL
ncbi:hypothetical protein MRS44_012584 [Fusarium solani]|uniref:uncharacterized protein n=1 Tax=Fusarium solani TaxID=169388 RepID=UPI0032C43638|nr:hypothetical protein MRS44_012584 [Fusarium solani]